MPRAAEELFQTPLESLTLYHAADPILSSVLVFCGPVVTANSRVSSSRIQAHVVSAGGARSYPQITVSPTASIYAPVHYLPRDQQGDPDRRGLAVCIAKYFNDIRPAVKQELLRYAESSGGQLPPQSEAFDEVHAAGVATRMTLVKEPADIARSVRDTYGRQYAARVDAHLVLPPQTVKPFAAEGHWFDDSYALRYGEYAHLVSALGEPVCLSTSRLKRAASPTKTLGSSKVFKRSHKEALRLAMCEVVDTEERYVGKLYELTTIFPSHHDSASAAVASDLSREDAQLLRSVPSCLQQILSVNMRFLDEIRQILEATEGEALDDISSDSALEPGSLRRGASGKYRDAMGAIPFARALLAWFPQFATPYREYMRSQQPFSRVITTTAGRTSLQPAVETSEQKVRSLLMEPVQRLPRYSLLIDSMCSALPDVHPACRTLLKARDIVSDICSLNADAKSGDTQTPSILQVLLPSCPSHLLPTGRFTLAVDAYSLQPPFRASMVNAETHILLLFTDRLLIAKTLDGSQVKARILASQLDKRGHVDLENRTNVEQLIHVDTLSLHGLQVAQSVDGRVVYLTLPERATHAFELTGPHEGKAGDFINELIQARLGDQFSAQSHVDGTLSLHELCSSDQKFTCSVALFEEDVLQPRHQSAIRIIVEGTSAIERHQDIDISGVISRVNQDSYRLQLSSITGQSAVDCVASRDLARTLADR
ncbi:hypothetical protein KEM52_005669, partial [Ascosphaera acerosa]